MTSTIANVSGEFLGSYQVYERYPSRLIYPTTYSSALQSYEDRLEAAAPRLCVDDNKDVKIGVRDFWERKGMFQCLKSSTFANKDRYGSV